MHAPSFTRLIRGGGISAVALLLASQIPGQAPPGAGDLAENIAPEGPSTLTLAYGDAHHLAVGSSHLGITIPFHCGSDGTIQFVGLSFSPPQLDFTAALYFLKVSDSISYVRFDAAAPDLRQVTPTQQFAASGSRVVWLVNAITSDEEINDKRTKPHPFLLFFDLKGTVLRATPLSLPFTVGSIGLFDSGEVLLIGSTAFDSHQHWMLMDEDGDFQRDLLTGWDDDAKQGTGIETIKSRSKSMSGLPQLVPYHGNFLLAETNSSHPIVEINTSGIVKETELNLPKGEDIGEFIPTDGRTWKLVLGHTNEKEENGLPSGYLKLDKIGEFDPTTGELLKYIDAGKDHYPSSLACEVGGEYLAIRTDPKDGSLVVEKGTPSH